MRKTFGMNKHQKAAHKKGEVHVSREQVAELLELSCSADPEERLFAAGYLCPCHVKGRIPAVWEALYRMMEDTDPRVRFAAWHTLEDGGLPDDTETFTRLERIYKQETDPKVRRFAQTILSQELAARKAQEQTLLHLASRPERKQRGKCDFCGESDLFVDYRFDTLIPTGSALPRAALICEHCAQTV